MAKSVSKEEASRREARRSVAQALHRQEAVVDCQEGGAKPKSMRRVDIGGAARRQSESMPTRWCEEQSCFRTERGKSSAFSFSPRAKKEARGRRGPVPTSRLGRARGEAQEGFMDFDCVIATPDMMVRRR